MKKFFVLTVLVSAMMMYGCGKSEKKTIKVKTPELKMEQLTIKEPGHKCDLIGEIESKEIFVNLEAKEGRISISFHDFIKKEQISTASAQFEGYLLNAMILTPLSETERVLIGEKSFNHTDADSLSDEGKVISIIGKLTLKEDMSGVLARKLKISKTDQTVEETEYKELGKFENCEPFEATLVLNVNIPRIQK